MRSLTIATLLATISTAALASDNYTQDARDLSAAALCGATNTSCQTGFKTGATSTAASKRLETAYKAIRAAEVPPPPPPAPVPVPVPPPPAPVPPPVIDPNVPTTGLPMVADGLDTNALLVPSWGTGAIPASAGPPDKGNPGAFRLICQAAINNAGLAAMIKYDDPIVYPGQPGKSHLHQFFGNTKADAFSTYESLRKTGESSCANALNRSAYWMPAMMDGKGFVVPPDYVTIYYKRFPKGSADCFKQAKGGCVDLPRGLRFIFGRNMLNMAELPTGAAYFNCDGPGAIPGHYPDIPTAAKNCPVGARLGAVINAPDCWDGKNLDSPDHRKHVAYAAWIGHSYAECPSTHPYVIPAFTMGAWFTTDATLDRSGTWDGTFNSWHLSSDDMPGMPMKPGTTFHADWFGAWSDSVLKMWHDGCLDKLLNCSGADTGTGLQLKQAYADNWGPRPRVPVPVKP